MIIIITYFVYIHHILHLNCRFVKIAVREVAKASSQFLITRVRALSITVHSLVFYICRL